MPEAFRDLRDLEPVAVAHHDHLPLLLRQSLDQLEEPGIVVVVDVVVAADVVVVRERYLANVTRQEVLLDQPPGHLVHDHAERHGVDLPGLQLAPDPQKDLLHDVVGARAPHLRPHPRLDGGQVGGKEACVVTGCEESGVLDVSSIGHHRWSRAGHPTILRVSPRLSWADFDEMADIETIDARAAPVRDRIGVPARPP